jgi:hypothetical protein
VVSSAVTTFVDTAPLTRRAVDDVVHGSSSPTAHSARAASPSHRTIIAEQFLHANWRNTLLDKTLQNEANGAFCTLQV